MQIKFLKIFSIIIFLISFFLLAYTFYRSEIYYNGNNREFYLIYYIISLVFLIFSILFIYLSEVIKIYLTIILCTTAFSLYSFEIFLLLKKNYDVANQLNYAKSKFEKENLNKNFDSRTPYEAYIDLKKDDPELVISFMTKTHVFNGKNLISFSGISNTNTLFCNELGYYSNYKSDRYGFNNPDDEWDEQLYEYIVLGDSSVHGACVNRPHDIASVLRKITNKGVLNLGIRGSGPLTQYAILKEYMPTQKISKKILWFFSADTDLNDLMNEINSQSLILYLNNLNYSQNLKLKQYQIDESLRNNIQIELEKKFANNTKKNFIFFKHLKLFLVRSLFKPEPKIPSEFEKVLIMTRDLAIINNSSLYFVYIPNLTRYFDMKFINYDDEIKKIVTDLGIPYLNLDEEVYSKQKNPRDLFPLDSIGHPNIKGYEIIAKTINQILKK